MTTPIPQMPLHQIPAGSVAECFALLAERTRGTTREGKPYYSCKFRDRHRSAAAMIWYDGPWFQACESEWRPGNFFRLRCTYGEHERYGAQIEIHAIRYASDEDRDQGFDPAELIDSTRFGIDAMYDELLHLAQSQIKDAALAQLTAGLLRRYSHRVRTAPATLDRFHPFRGGWLEHTLSVTRTCIMLADHYLTHYSALVPPLNRDLVVAGALLHDIGRFVEFTDEVAAALTVPGSLHGHQILGRDLIRDAAREAGGVNPELLMLLEHMVLAHLALPAWGSARFPVIPEVLILHHADDLDAKLEMFARCLSRSGGDGPFTAPDPVLKKPLLRQRAV